MAIIVCADLESDERETHSLMACCASTQNILLKATELGIGSLWLGLYPDKERIKFVKEELNIPNNMFHVSLIALGYKKDSKTRYREIDESKIHFNRW